MIFVTVGTENFPFDRLIRTVDRGIKDKSFSDQVFMQIGGSTYEPKNCSWKRFVEFGIIIDLIRKARIIITHAGTGSVLLCLTLNKIPLVFPRYHKYGEHLDDHQIAFTKRMEQEGKVLAAYDEIELVNKIQNYDSLIREINVVDNNTRHKEGLASYLAKLLS